MKRKWLLLGLALLLLLSGCAPRSSMPPALGKAWSVGYGEQAIIPDGYDAETGKFTRKYYIAGYQNNKLAAGVLDFQYARAAYLSDGTGNEIILASIDCIGISKKNLDQIKRRLRDLKVDAIHIMSTHTHAGIDTLGLWGPVGMDGKDDDFMARVYDAAETAIRSAYANAKTGRLYYGFHDTGTIQHDSRAPLIYDRNIYRIRFAPDDGTAGVQLISYDAHPESLRSANAKVSADFPCYMGREIKSQTGDDTIFFAGAVGGLIMTNVIASPAQVNAERTGKHLADCVLAIDNETELAPSVISDTEIVRMRLENPMYHAMIFAGVLDVEVAKDFGLITGRLKADTEVSLVTLGGSNGVSIALVPGELFPELRPDDDVLIYGLANDEIGYLVAPDNYLLNEEAPFVKRAMDKTGEDHYEETNSVGRDSAMVRDVMEQLIADRNQRFQKADCYDEAPRP